MLGAYVTGLTGDTTSTLFAVLIGLALPALYIMLGAAWLLIKTEGELFQKAARWGRLAVLPMGAFLLLVSIATPLVSETIAAKWFTLPNAIGLMPIPIATGLAYAGLIWIFNSRQILDNGYGWLAFLSLIVICVLASIGSPTACSRTSLGQLSIWEAAFATESLLFTFWGAVIALPMILGYTVFIYRVFRGKATHQLRVRWSSDSATALSDHWSPARYGRCAGELPSRKCHNDIIRVNQVTKNNEKDTCTAVDAISIAGLERQGQMFAVVRIALGLYGPCLPLAPVYRSFHRLCPAVCLC